MAPQRIGNSRQAAQPPLQRSERRAIGGACPELLQGLQLLRQEAANSIVQWRRVPGALERCLGHPGPCCVHRMVRCRLAINDRIARTDKLGYTALECIALASRAPVASNAAACELSAGICPASEVLSRASKPKGVWKTEDIDQRTAWATALKHSTASEVSGICHDSKHTFFHEPEEWWAVNGLRGFQNLKP